MGIISLSRDLGVALGVCHVVLVDSVEDRGGERQQVPCGFAHRTLCEIVLSTV